MVNFVAGLRNTKIAQYFEACVSCVRMRYRPLAFLYV